MSLAEAAAVLSEIGRGRIQDYLDEAGRLDPERIAAGGRDVQEFTETIGPDGMTRRLRLDQVKALSLLARLQGWESPERHDVAVRTVRYEIIDATATATGPADEAAGDQVVQGPASLPGPGDRP